MKMSWTLFCRHVAVVLFFCVFFSFLFLVRKVKQYREKNFFKNNYIYIYMFICLYILLIEMSDIS